jgi:hypothetical protein
MTKSMFPICSVVQLILQGANGFRLYFNAFESLDFPTLADLATAEATKYVLTFRFFLAFILSTATLAP